MLVVSDTSPLNYLILIDAQHVLPALYDAVLVPTQVIEELRREKAPERVRGWANHLPAWVVVQAGDASRFPALNYGEAAALAMALDAHARLLVDEADARSTADALGVLTIGTIGILAEAHLKSLLDFDATIQTLSTTTFRVHANVFASARSQILVRQPGYGRKGD